MLEHPIVIDLVLLLVAVAGISLASYIRHCKTKKKPLVCPIDGSCDMVTGSEYSKFLGIPVELIGIAYYLIVALFHLAVLFVPWIFTPVVAAVSLGLSASAFLFSIYLTCIQAFILKHWCTWCVTSALLCAAIFLTTYLAVPAGLFL
jgi:uncharacterized membrane protein